jgi:hypothetical protein
MNRIGTVVMVAAGALAALLTVGAIGYQRYGDFRLLLPEDVAGRLLELHDRSCTPALVSQGDMTLEVRCSDGRHLSFARQPSCDGPTFACDVLSLDAFCYDRL